MTSDRWVELLRIESIHQRGIIESTMTVLHGELWRSANDAVVALTKLTSELSNNISKMENSDES